MQAEDLEAIRQRHAKASDELSSMCKGAMRGGHNFHMSIPVHRNDSDILIGDALNDIPALLKGYLDLWEAASEARNAWDCDVWHPRTLDAMKALEAILYPTVAE